jgi:uncharacterized membrane protein
MEVTPETQDATAAPVDVPPPESRRPAPHVVPAAALRLEAGEPSALLLIARAMTLIGVEALSAGIFVWGLRVGSRIVSYSRDNTISALGRTYLLADMLGALAIAAVAAGVFAVVARSSTPSRLERIARRCAPVAVLGPLPFLLREEIWVGRDLPFLVFAACFALSARLAVRAAIAVGPVTSGGVARAAEAVRARAARAAARLRPWAPTALVLLGAAGYAAYFAFFTVRNHHDLRTASLDLGLEDNLIWNLIHGGQFMKSSPLVGPTGTHFGYHATLFAYVIGTFYALAPRAETLLVFQAIMIGGAAVPLYLFARRHIGVWMAALLAFVYLFYPPVHGSNLYDFHYLPLGPFFLWLTLYLVDSRRDRWAILAVILTLSVREDVSAGLVIVGLIVLFYGGRPKAGLLLAAVGGAYFVLLKMIIMPRFLAGGSSFIHQYQGLLPSGEHGFGGVLKTVIANPVFTMANLLEQEKVVYFLQLAVPLCFLPWTRSIGLLCSLPGFLFTLLETGYSPLVQISFQYTAHWSAFLFIAVVYNLQAAGGAAPGGALASAPSKTAAPARAAQLSWMAGIVAATFVTTHQYGAILQRHTARGGFGVYNFETTAIDLERRASVAAMVRAVPRRAKIAASEFLVPQVSNRPDAYTLRVGIFDAEYMLFQLPLGGEEARHVEPVVADGTFGVIDLREPFALLRRGAQTTRNAEILPRIH